MFSGSQPPPAVPQRDRMGVLTSTWPVVQVAEQVRLNGDQVVRVAREWSATPWADAPWDATLHWTHPEWAERQANWVLVLDALNFCFWPITPAEPRWQVAWQGQTHNGYNALAASLARAVEEGKPLWNAVFLAAMDDQTALEIFRPAPDAQGKTANIPLFPERVMHLREIGEVLLRHYRGQFLRAIEAAQGDVVALVRAVVRNVPSFRDLALWEGQEVLLYKRAQILVADLAGAFGQRGPGRFDNLGELTAFADYKVPQLLRRLGILEYGADLANQIDRFEQLPPGSAEEVAIRAGTIWGVEWLRQALAANALAVTPAQIDWRLWLAGQTLHADDRPYHRTPTIFY